MLQDLQACNEIFYGKNADTDILSLSEVVCKNVAMGLDISGFKTQCFSAALLRT